MASSEAEVRQAQMQLQQGLPCHKQVNVQSQVACSGRLQRCHAAPNHVCIRGCGRCTHSLREMAGLRTLRAVTVLCHKRALRGRCKTSGPPVRRGKHRRSCKCARLRSGDVVRCAAGCIALEGPTSSGPAHSLLPTHTWSAMHSSSIHAAKVQCWRVSSRLSAYGDGLSVRKAWVCRLCGLTKCHAMQPGCSALSQPLSVPPMCIAQE